MTATDLDVIIIGAGLSGIGAARYLKRKCKGKSFAILEGKPRMGGTWDLFRYPGIRSDSDMHTMGYAFKAWTNPKAISDGESIRNYIIETAQENDLTRHMRFEHKVLSADWSSDEGRWTLTIDHAGEEVTLTCKFIFSCSGYYKHEEGYLPEWEGYDSFKGECVHPQFWPETLDYTGKRVVIIGSGATAVTLLPTLAEKAAHVVQLQRSPTFVVSRPGEDAFANKLRKYLPDLLAYKLTRLRTILMSRVMRKRMSKDIAATKRLLIGGVAKQLGDSCDWKTHFVPSYLPGQQRICMVPDGDMFKAIRGGKASVVTGEIVSFNEAGIRLTSGEQVDADIIITATGLVMEFMGGVAVSVDGQRVDPSKLLIYKGFMYSNIPNMIYFRGYTNASWTLKVDLVAEYACRLLKLMDRRGISQVTPLATEEDFAQPKPSNAFISGYVVRTAHLMPKHGSRFPWVHEQDYFWDRKTLLRGKVDDGTLRLGGATRVEFPPAQRDQQAAVPAVAAE